MLISIFTIFLSTHLLAADHGAAQAARTSSVGETKYSRMFDGTVVTWTRLTHDELSVLGITNAEKFGEAWKENHTGLVWGDVPKKPDGSIQRMTQSTAIEYCRSLGAELPSKQDFRHLREYLGGASEEPLNPVDPITGYSPQVLPNLTWKTGEGKIRSTKFRAFDVEVDEYGDVNSVDFDGKDGIIGEYLAEATFASHTARCVLKTKSANSRR